MKEHCKRMREESRRIALIYLKFCSWQTFTNGFGFKCATFINREVFIVWRKPRLPLLVHHQDKLDHVCLSFVWHPDRQNLKSNVESLPSIHYLSFSSYPIIRQCQQPRVVFVCPIIIACRQALVLNTCDLAKCYWIRSLCCCWGSKGHRLCRRRRKCNGQVQRTYETG